MAVKEKITNNKDYNVFLNNNSGSFVCVAYYTVGRDGYENQFSMSGRKDLALSLCEKLNQELEKDEFRKALEESLNT